MNKTSRVEIDSRGTIVRVDPSFCAMMRDTPDRLVGTHMLILTAPADHAKCTALFARLVEHGTPFSTVKRLIRRDMSHVWIFTRGEETAQEEGDRRFALSICESAAPVPRRDPSKLLDATRFMIAARRQRRAIFSSPLFADHAWDIISLAYVAEAEGTVLTPDDLAADTGLAIGSLTRWIRALRAEELLEVEGHDVHLPGAPIRLSAVGHRKFEEHIGKLVNWEPDEDVLVS
jgi:PAS domain S-box-containing protein